MEFLISRNPGDNFEEIGRVAVTRKEDIAKKIEQAQVAKKAWKLMTLDGRLKILKKLPEKVRKHKTQLATLVSKEMGMPISQSLADLTDAMGFWDWYLEHAEEYLEPQVIEEGGGKKLVVMREPIGLVAVISPWNFPVSNFVWSCAQNLIAGNVVIYKPSEEVPLVAQLLEKIIEECDWPLGVLSVVHGTAEEGKYLVEQNIDMLGFTGSTQIGKKLYETAGKKFIKALLEMGGSAPGLVFEDAHINSTVESIFDNRFTNCGQMCDALKRLLVHENIADKVIEKLVQHVEAKVVGNPLDKQTDIGPLISLKQLEILESQVADAISKGAEIVCGGKRPERLKGAYYLPTILRKITRDMRVWKEEVFGPVLPIMTFKDEEEAIALANDTDYGLGSYVYSGDIETAWRMAQKIEAGMVSINGQGYVSECSPFGGYKQSGMGRTHGRYGFEDVTQVKVIALPHYDSV